MQNDANWLCRTRLYGIWEHMKRRCCNTSNSDYARYGGRGITVCEEWKNSFETFRAWALKNGYVENLTIDRINNNGNYEPSNCRWATVKEQANNRRTNRYLTYAGETLTVAEWADKLGVNQDRLHNRLTRGWNDERVLKTPVDKSKSQIYGRQWRGAGKERSNGG